MPHLASDQKEEHENSNGKSMNSNSNSNSNSNEKNEIDTEVVQQRAESVAYIPMQAMLLSEDLGIDVSEAYLEPEGKLALPSTVPAIPTLLGVHKDEFDAEATAKRIHQVASKWFQKKANIVDVLIHELCVLNEDQRMQVVLAYGTKHKSHHLHKLIRGNTKNKLQDILSALTMTRFDYDAHWLHVALRKKSVNLLLTILCTMPSAEHVRLAHAAYDRLYPKTPLVKSVLDQTSGWFFHKRTIYGFFSNLLEKGRVSDVVPIDEQIVLQDAHMLVKASQSDKLDKSPFVEIFSLRSYEHLAAMAVAFQQISQGKDLIQVIKQSFKEQSETGYACNITLYYATRRYELLADLLRKAVVTPGKHYEMLTRIIVSRAEVDLCNILQAYGREEFRQWVLKHLQTKNQVYAQVILTLCGFHKLDEDVKKNNFLVALFFFFWIVFVCL
ncbi:hypothetical protein RFI_22670 [Reticulomyxa filosa]|uniref:Uncharacterized protein n=1 Tax=Reticulomyxa filosa TaxID=46433 RepID=X6MLD8_RETFI|nr:hypothetical protein RFI_22670 [Reticulomyxa filosa]|eukprot:ETO14699.1 hypothetical protein RFI_22670 [Reticulomyxa filosa]